MHILWLLFFIQQHILQINGFIGILIFGVSINMFMMSRGINFIWFHSLLPSSYAYNNGLAMIFAQ